MLTGRLWGDEKEEEQRVGHRRRVLGGHHFIQTELRRFRVSHDRVGRHRRLRMTNIFEKYGILVMRG
jgi:hypothetical protein